MPEYRRLYEKGGTYFFTVVTYRRIKIFTDDGVVDLLKNTFSKIMENHPLKIDAIVILPDHLHTIWTLPENDADFSTRWMLIKNRFTQSLKKHNSASLTPDVCNKRIWQNRFWEHLIRDQEDFIKHCNYIHYNPVKHGFVASPSEWRYSSFKKFVQLGHYDIDWAENLDSTVDMNIE